MPQKQKSPNCPAGSGAYIFCKTCGDRSGNGGKTLLFQKAVKKFATDKDE